MMQASPFGLSASSQSGYRELEDLRTRLYRLSLDQTTPQEEVVRQALVEARSFVAFEAFAIYLLNRAGQLERVDIQSNGVASWPKFECKKNNAIRDMFSDWSETSAYAPMVLDERGSFVDAGLWFEFL